MAAAPAPGSGSGPAPARLRGWRNLLRLAVLAVFVVAIALVLARRWNEVRPLLRSLQGVDVALAMVAVAAAIFATFLCWRAVLTDLGSPLPLTSGMRVFFLGQLGKYLPGGVWPLLAQMELGRGYKVARRTSAAAVMIFMLLLLGSGLLVAALALPLLGSDALPRYGWTLSVLPVAAVLLYPPVLNRVLALGLRLARREPMPKPLSLRGVLGAVGWSLAGWLLFGVHVWILARMLGVHGAGLLARSTGAFAAAWCVGFLVVIAPAGSGAREAALIVLLGTGVGTARATVIAVVSRLLLTVGDLGWGGGAAITARRRRAERARQRESVG
ncbi:MAG TPA: lysylphosphatidylglycerol synthase domain-containing protein [Actinomycetes bacterium]|nr:lysylphosphatidylglycerol synthase domain-containing protein [Actinomycetes bacterium]